VGLGSANGTLAAKASEIVASCGSTVISSLRNGARIAGSGHASLHASGRAVDVKGNPRCIYSHLQGRPAVIPLTMAQYSTSTFPWEGSRTGFDLRITRTIVGVIRQVAETTVASLCTCIEGHNWYRSCGGTVRGSESNSPDAFAAGLSKRHYAKPGRHVDHW
jgi:hypothetical protein